MYPAIPESSSVPERSCEAIGGAATFPAGFPAPKYHPWFQVALRSNMPDSGSRARHDQGRQLLFCAGHSHAPIHGRVSQAMPFQAREFQCDAVSRFSSYSPEMYINLVSISQTNPALRCTSNSRGKVMIDRLG